MSEMWSVPENDGGVVSPDVIFAGAIDGEIVYDRRTPEREMLDDIKKLGQFSMAEDPEEAERTRRYIDMVNLQADLLAHPRSDPQGHKAAQIIEQAIYLLRGRRRS